MDIIELLKFIVYGVFSGGMLGFGVAVVYCLYGEGKAFLFGEYFDDQAAINLGIRVGIFIFIIFLIWGISEGRSSARASKKRRAEELEEERRKKAEEARIKRQNELAIKKEEENKKFTVWSKQLAMYYRQIENKSLLPVPENLYVSIERLLSEGDKKYLDNFKAQTVEHIAKMEDRVLDLKTRNHIDTDIRKVGLEDTIYACKCLMLIKKIESGFVDPIYQKLLNVFEPLNLEMKKTVHYLQVGDYGSINIPLDETEEMIHIENRITGLEAKLKVAWDYVDSFKENRSIAKKVFSSEFDQHYLEETAMLMWYYAKKVPFNIEKFEEMQKFFKEFTCVYIQQQGEEEVSLNYS